jgi:hypothetical protein
VKARALFIWVALISTFFLWDVADSEAARRQKRRSKGPRTTHPMLLWSKTLSESANVEERRVNAYKLSQYSQPIFQDSVVDTLTKCTQDPDLRIRVHCTKALGNATQPKHVARVRKTLLERFNEDGALKSTIARVFQAREDDSTDVQLALMKELTTSTNTDEINAILEYFEKMGDGTDTFVKSLTALYRRMGDAKVRRNVVKALSERAQGQDAVVELFAQCAQDGHTPLALMCLSGLQQQAKTDQRAWKAVESTIGSDDPDVLIASLDVIQALPESVNTTIATRLVEISEDNDDPDIQEKAILALGVCGDASSGVVKALLRMLTRKEGPEGIRIAAALVLGKQGRGAAEQAKSALAACKTGPGSKGLKTACELGLKELESSNPSLASPSETSQAAPQEKS